MDAGALFANPCKTPDKTKPKTPSLFCSALPAIVQIA
jgi:hypothetical protein